MLQHRNVYVFSGHDISLTLLFLCLYQPEISEARSGIGYLGTIEGVNANIPARIGDISTPPLDDIP